MTIATCWFVSGGDGDGDDGDGVVVAVAVCSGVVDSC